jgi:hypothetical protein
MRKVERSEILDYVSYEEQRDAIRAQVMETKRKRRVHAGEYLTFLFENAETVRYQVLEMVRTERMVKESDIQHELGTYNELLGGTGQLGATLLIEIGDEQERAEKLRAWVELMPHVYAKLDDGTRVPAQFDPRQVGEDRLSSVQYIVFDTKGRVPVALGADHPALTMETALSDEQRAALEQDLKSDRDA